MEEELLAYLFAAAVNFSGLPAVASRPPIQAMPYKEMLQEVCADLQPESEEAQASYTQCIKQHKMMPSVCGQSAPDTQRYERCMSQRGLMAAYIMEQHRIVFRNELDLNNDTDNSFIVHEFVHALQQHYFGDQLFETCQGVFRAEKQAYAAQQKYLDSRGQLIRVGERLRFVTCGNVL